MAASGRLARLCKGSYLRFGAIGAGAALSWSLDADLKGGFRENGFRAPRLQKDLRCGLLERLGWAACGHLAVWDSREIAATMLPHRRKAA